MLYVNCILEVKYCITSVNVYMEMNFVDKNLTDLSYLTAFFCIVNLMVSHCKSGKKKKRFQIILAGTLCTFPLSFYVCVSKREWVCVWQWHLAFMVQQGLSFVRKWSQNIEPIFYFLSFFYVASTVFEFFPSKIGNKYIL